MASLRDVAFVSSKPRVSCDIITPDVQSPTAIKDGLNTLPRLER